jgi:hypothetical protein
MAQHLPDPKRYAADALQPLTSGPTCHPSPLAALLFLHDSCPGHPMHRQIPCNPSPFRMLRPLYKTPSNSSLISLRLLSKPSTGCRKIARRSSARLRASPHRFGAHGEPHASFSPPTFFSQTGASPWSPIFILSAVEQRNRPTAKAHCRPTDLQPPLTLTSRSN